MRHIIDLDRYPLDREGSQDWHDMVAAAQAALQQGGMFSLEGFLRPGVAAQAAAEIAPAMASDSYLHQRRHNIYFKPEIPGLAADHPALRQVQTTNHTVCADQMPGSLVMAVYEYPHWLSSWRLPWAGRLCM